VILLALVIHDPGCEAEPAQLPELGVYCTCDGEIHATSLDGFEAANVDDQGALDAARNLGPGGRCDMGGGAAPRFTIWRIA
jgi:hypothetical protein